MWAGHLFGLSVSGLDFGSCVSSIKDVGGRELSGSTKCNV